MGLFDFRKPKKQKRYTQADAYLMEGLMAQKSIRDAFQPVEIGNQVCLYREIEGGEVVLIKIWDQRIRFGKLINWIPDPTVPAIKINVTGLDPDLTEDFLGFERGYFFVEMAYSDVFDWQAAYRQYLSNEEIFKRLGQKKNREWLSPISLKAYLEAME